MSNENFQYLANAIVLQAVCDYRAMEREHDLIAMERFFRSDWFGMLTNLDPEYLISKLREEKQNECESIFRTDAIS